MDSPLDGLASMHFALIYIDDSGKVRFEASPSIANSCQSLLAPNVTESFLRAVALSNKGGESRSSSIDTSRKSSPSPRSPSMHDNGESQPPIGYHVESHRPKRKRISHESVIPISINCHQRTMLPVQDHGLLRRYYEKAFESLQQINCRILAKAYIKLVEPRKQVNYPYNGRKIIQGTSQQFDPEFTKPAWWPAGVTHREPDHLLKAERIRLLVHILCELRHSHAITVDKLKEADQSIRRQILPAERLQVLDEIYTVREEEEAYLDGHTDGRAAVCVSRVHLPDIIETQTLGSPSSALKPDMNPVYRKEVPDMESHTSVFPSTGSSPTSEQPRHAEKEAATKSSSSLPATWDACVPPLAKHTRDSDPTYHLDMSSPSIFHQDNGLVAQNFQLKYYSDHLGPQQHHSSLPVMGVPGHDMGAHPYYFGYQH
ncbi:predicted protein [Aspergillus terreus NIH2624]|uniref:Subtelomeric hrmA-associated cluster protein AFUB-079030/YDR124W-like helical bundle domain-containing protein n=1 Tax=Aspergillus terreus (strain NIH 2624 / FGSC A1156) TaxID=341663 RepID=Q0CSC2_ASPTN|nr:uncharacterized protein ATEG_03412 [Aspergillus terreus NIH2624]EAU36686.1 predicted protein [Aspergillus terreus NIH2624]